MIKKHNILNSVIIDEDGFCTDEDFKTCISESYLMEFNLSREINKTCYQLFDDVKLYDEDYIGKFVMSSFNKIHKTFQSVIIMCSRGLEEQSKMLIRSVLDKLMITVAVVNDENNYNKWISLQRNEKIV